jgi:hypothetical protein
MEAIALVHSSLQLKMMKPSSTMKKLLISAGAVIVGLDVTTSVSNVYGLPGGAVLVVGIVYSVWCLLMAGVSLYTSYKLRGAIFKIHNVTSAAEVTELDGKGKTTVTPTAAGSGPVVTGGTKDSKDASPLPSVVVKYGKDTSSPGTSTPGDGKKVPKEKGIFHKSKDTGKMMLGIGEKLQGVLFYVNISSALLILVFVVSLLMALDTRFASPLAYTIITSLPVFMECTLSLSDMKIISTSMDST